MQIESIRYKSGTIGKLSHRKKLQAIYFLGDQISDELVSIIEENEILSISGVLGSKEGGSPIEYEEIFIVSGSNKTLIEVYNRGLSILFSETPELKQVFPLCSSLRENLRL